MRNQEKQRGHRNCRLICRKRPRSSGRCSRAQLRLGCRTDRSQLSRDFPPGSEKTKTPDLSIGGYAHYGRFFHATIIVAAANTNQFSFALRDPAPKFEPALWPIMKA